MLQSSQKTFFFIGKNSYFKVVSSLFIIAMGVFLLPKTAYLATITPEKIIELTNRERVRAGLQELTENDLLKKAAYEKANTILNTENFSHTIGGQKFSSWIKQTGYQYSFIGENLAMDFATSEGIMDAWLDSKAHKENIINPEYSEIGVATIEGKFKGQNTIIVVQTFGAPPVKSVQPKITEAENIYPIFNQTFGQENFWRNSLLTDSTNGNPVNSYLMKYNLKYDFNNYQSKNVNTFFSRPNINIYLTYFASSLPYLYLIFIFYLYLFYISRFMEKRI